eukprot:g5904.t1
MPKKGRFELMMEAKRKKAHDDFISRARATVDCNMPRSMKCAHLKKNRKRQQMLAAKYANIQRDNETMLRNMNAIFKYGNRTGEIEPPNHYKKSIRARARISLDRQNRELRRLRTESIRQENRFVRRRVKQASPILNARAWESDFRRHRALSRHMSGLEPEIDPKRKLGGAMHAVRATRSFARRPMTSPINGSRRKGRRNFSSRPNSRQSVGFHLQQDRRIGFSRPSTRKGNRHNNNSRSPSSEVLPKVKVNNRR